MMAWRGEANESGDNSRNEENGLGSKVEEGVRMQVDHPGDVTKQENSYEKPLVLYDLYRGDGKEQDPLIVRAGGRISDRAYRSLVDLCYKGEIYAEFNPEEQQYSETTSE